MATETAELAENDKIDRGIRKKTITAISCVGQPVNRPPVTTTTTIF